MIRPHILLAAPLGLMIMAAPVRAHELSVFAAAKGNDVDGYVTFAGSGRAKNVQWIARNGQGQTLASGFTDAEGRFAFDAPLRPQETIVTANTREGHMASVTLPASAFVAMRGTAPASQAAATPDPRLAAMVEDSVQRQVEPLREQIDALDSGLRFTDIISGVFLILGLAGILSWAMRRRA